MLGACGVIATPYRGIRRQNQCYLGDSRPARRARDRAENGLSATVNGRKPRPYWPLFFSTWSQAVLILGRCSFRQARMVKSP